MQEAGTRIDQGRASMSRYHINVFWSEEDKAWVADVPDLKFCSAFGDTPEAALKEVKRAMEAWLETARESGHAIPKPSFRPAIYAAPANGRPARARG
jgi:predicted RNase H-like HicB family nuclease